MNKFALTADYFDRCVASFPSDPIQAMASLSSELSMGESELAPDLSYTVLVDAAIDMLRRSKHLNIREFDVGVRLGLCVGVLNAFDADEMEPAIDALERMFVVSNKVGASCFQNHSETFWLTAMTRTLSRNVQEMKPETYAEFVKMAPSYGFKCEPATAVLNNCMFSVLPWKGEFARWRIEINQGMIAICQGLFGENLGKVRPREREFAEKFVDFARVVSDLGRNVDKVRSYQFNTLLVAQLLAGMRVSAQTLSDCEESARALSEGVVSLVRMSVRDPGDKITSRTNSLRPEEKLTDWGFWGFDNQWESFLSDLVKACRNLNPGLSPKADAAMDHFKLHLIQDCSTALASMDGQLGNKRNIPVCRMLISEMSEICRSLTRNPRALAGLSSKAKCCLTENVSSEEVRRVLLENNKSIRGEILSGALGL